MSKHCHSHHANQDEHQHAEMDMAGDFLRRFIRVTIYLLPLLALSELGQSVFGLPQFTAAKWGQLAIASVIFWEGRIFFQHALHELRSKQPGMMTLVSIAVAAGFGFSAAGTVLPELEASFYLEISSLIWVLLFGHYLEAKSSTAAGDALQEVAALLPSEAHRILDGGVAADEVEDVSVQDLRQGDLVLVKAGEKVPADGSIRSEGSYFDESHLTGESRPVKKDTDEMAVAGAIVKESRVVLEVTRTGDDSTIGQIQSLIRDAQQSKPQSQRLADRAALWLTGIALSVALATLLGWTFIAGQSFVFGLTLAITVLVITCPHALGLAIPAVTTIGTRLAVKRGLFIKDLSKLERIKDVTMVVFDKTGTLTTGDFGVREIATSATSEAASKRIETGLKATHALEKTSSHPLAAALIEYFEQEDIGSISLVETAEVSGKGMTAKSQEQEENVVVGTAKFLEAEDIQLDTSLLEQSSTWAEDGLSLVHVAYAGEHIASFGLGDEIKDSSAMAVQQLHNRGIAVAMISGDDTAVAEAVAEKLQIDRVQAEVLPEDKVNVVKELQTEGEVVLMTGDGINDGPALTQADIGVAVGAGTDVAVEAGDVVLTKSDPADVVELLHISKKIYRKMIQNLWWALGYNIIAIPAAAGVFLPWGVRLRPDVGAFLMSLSSVIVVVNAFTLWWGERE